MSGEVEVSTCDICKKEAVVSRKYYHYPIECECCNGPHFEIVRNCKDCEPKPPNKIVAVVKHID